MSYHSFVLLEHSQQTLCSIWQEIIKYPFFPRYCSRGGIQRWATAPVFNENSLLGRIEHRNTADVEREGKEISNATRAETLFNFVRLLWIHFYFGNMLPYYLFFICPMHRSQLENTSLKEIIISYNIVMRQLLKSTLGKKGYCNSAVINLLNRFHIDLQRSEFYYPKTVVVFF